MQILCTVDIRTRELYLEDVTIAAFDHLVDDVLFVIEPIDGFQLETSTIKIAAVGPLGEPHDYEIDPSTVTVDEETGNINFVWSIPVGVTAMPLTAFKISDTKNITFAVCAEIVSGDNLVKAWHSDDGTIKVKAHLEPESGGGEDPSETATNAQKIGQLQSATAILQREISGIASGTPPTASSTSEMDPGESTVYINTTDGNWYYYDGSAWQIGGVYGGAITSTTFTEHGVPADDFAVGQALAEKADADAVGDLSQLTTTAKTDLVSAINEVEADGEQLKADLTNKTKAMTVLQSANCVNPDELTTGFVTNTGSESSSSSYKHTGMIPVNTGETITAWRSVSNSFNTAVSSVNMRFICAYDNNFNVIPNDGSGSAVASYVVPDGVAYIIVSIEAAYFAYDVAIYKQAITPTKIFPYEQEFYGATPDFLPTNYKAKPGYFTLYQATYTTELLLPEINVTKQVNIAFSCRLGNGFTSVKVGNGVTDILPGATYDSFITVNSTKVIFTINNREHEYDHNLTISNYINISIHVRSDTKADVIVESGGGVYSRTIGWYGYGRTLYKARIVGSATECYFTVSLLDINADTYAFGDSYMAIIESPERWPHWLINAGFGNNVLFNACPGENSEQAIRAFQNIFTVGKPKYLLWALGMNDGADTDNTTPNATWKQYVDYVLMICERYGIVPILATIPTVPTINHEGKNAWVRSSGYRYIDFANAVGAQSNGTWFTGMLSQDGVHPTELGAHALWNRVQIDFPEIMILK